MASQATRASVTQPSLARRALSIACASVACILASCGTPPKPAAQPSSSAGVRAKTPAKPAPGLIGAPRAADASPATAFTSEPWTYNRKPGEIITTPHYRVYITDTRPTTLNRLPPFIEAALDHYRTALTGTETPLPTPDLRMETFVLDTRHDWEMLTKQLLGDKSPPFLRIRRGGFAYAGRALLFDIGAHDTLAVAAHEGWHQYTQRAFRNPLPIWLEEGLATFMEGHRWGGPTGGQALFLPWANVERFDQLRRAHAAGKVVGLKDLLTSSPQSLISATDSEPGLVYYAQVWALAHFLAEGAGGRYRHGLQTLLHDAAAGRIPQSVATILGPPAQGRGPLSALPRPIVLNVGPVLFLAYFNQNLEEAGREYRSFIAALVQPGSRGPIVAGTSPIAPAPTPATGMR